MEKSVFVKKVLTSKRLIILGRPFNYSNLIRVSIPNCNKMFLLKDILEEMEITDNVNSIFSKPDDDAKGFLIKMNDAVSWCKLAILIGKEIELLRQDNLDHGFCYPVAIIHLNGKYKITAITPYWIKKLYNKIHTYNINFEKSIIYPPYIGYA